MTRKERLRFYSYFLEFFFTPVLFLIFGGKTFFPEYFNMLNMGSLDSYLEYLYLIPFLVISFRVAVKLYFSRSIMEGARRSIFSILCIYPLWVARFDQGFFFFILLFHFTISLVFFFSRRRKMGEDQSILSGFIDKLKIQPAQLVIITFLLLIAIGSIVLYLPFSARTGKIVDFVDALFIATSATCVTGLSTISVIDHFSIFGQGAILLLIQIGGLGFMTLSTSLTIFIGRSLALKDKLVMQDLLNISSSEDLTKMLSDIVKYTFIIELWGALALTGAFLYQGDTLLTSLYKGVFHSISAFCNAGFALFNNSLETFTTNPYINIIIVFLIILGGLGFIVIREIEMVFRGQLRLKNLSVHSKIVLVTSGSLLLVGTAFFFFGEYLHTLDQYSLSEKMLISFFQSVTTRTAGFNTLPMANLQGYTIYFMVLMMFIGASPGSTGGGVKTTTFAILLESVRATLAGRDRVSFFNRNIAPEVVVKTTALTIVSLIIISVYILILVNFEPGMNFLALFFEVISAFATVGLSLGVTAELTEASKYALISLMFIGRIGALTLVLAIGQRAKGASGIKLPEGRVMIG